MGKILAEVLKRAGPLIAKAGKGLKDAAQKAYEWGKKKLSKEPVKENCKKCKIAADSIKKDDKLRRQMEQRGWTDKQVEEAIGQGEKFPAVNNQTGAAATRYVHPQTGRSVVVDNNTGGIIHVGGDGFLY